MAMIPIDFCASLEPCEKAMKPAESNCKLRKARLTRDGLTRRTTHTSVTINTKPPSSPKTGESTNAIRANVTPSDVPKAHSDSLAPAPSQTAWHHAEPTMPPISACDELDGMP